MYIKEDTFELSSPVVHDIATSVVSKNNHSNNIVIVDMTDNYNEFVNKLGLEYIVVYHLLIEHLLIALDRLTFTDDDYTVNGAMDAIIVSVGNDLSNTGDDEMSLLYYKIHNILLGQDYLDYYASILDYLFKNISCAEYLVPIRWDSVGDVITLHIFCSDIEDIDSILY